MHAQIAIPQASANALQAHDIEIDSDESEYQDVVACLPTRSSQHCKVVKVIRHQIPAALFNGGSGCRISWSVLADAGRGERLHYTIYNRKARQDHAGIASISRLLKRSRYYLGGCRHCCCDKADAKVGR